MADTKIVFGVCPAVPEQDELIKKYCFGDCGSILIGEIFDDEIGINLMPCREDNCPHEEKRGELGTMDTGETVWVRKLKDG